MEPYEDVVYELRFTKREHGRLDVTVIVLPLDVQAEMLLAYEGGPFDDLIDMTARARVAVMQDLRSRLGT